MLLFDGHLSLAMNGVDWNRDLRDSVEDVRAHETSHELSSGGRGKNLVTLPELKQAGITLCVASVFARHENCPDVPFAARTPEAAYAFAHAQLAWYRAMQRRGWLTILTTREELDQHWKAVSQQPATTPLGIILQLESCDPVLDPDNLAEWAENGIRSVGLTYRGPNRYGGGIGTEIGLALDAIPLLKNIEAQRLPIDTTNLSPNAFWQVVGEFSGMLYASHTASRRFCDGDRPFTDEQLDAIIERGGVVGIGLDVRLLQPGWAEGASVPEVTLERVAENIDHLCQLAGKADHVGIGSDLDGGFGYDHTPVDVQRACDLAKIGELLRSRNYNETDIIAILHGNWLRLFGTTLPSGKAAPQKPPGLGHHHANGVSDTPGQDVPTAEKQSS